MNRTLTVSGLTGYMKQLVDNDMLLSHVWVTGEISNYKHHTSGHMYFSLKDETAVIKCVMFKTQNIRLKFRPEEGMQVILRGYVSVYPLGGTYQLYADEMQPAGTGALYLAFEQLKQKLEARGCFDASRKKPIPVLPRAIGVVTSPTGAVIRDITQILTRRYPNARIVLYASAVQGSEAPAQLIKGIKVFNRLKNVDVIILARGGGSLEDLWPFNDETLALTILESEIPIISAVGHETDYSISDFVADLRAPTPSAAAELVMPEKNALKDGLARTQKRLSTALMHRLKAEKSRIKRLENVRSLRRPVELVNQKRQRLDVLEQRLVQRSRNRLDRFKSDLRVAAGKLNALSPLTVLSRGYSVAQKDDGTVVSSVKSLKPGEGFVLTVADGKIQAYRDKPVVRNRRREADGKD
ncbi:MAG: exodeoxyribonuclease VII large subunit [Clostridia bacterium]|nr:exodeoxyribonuclease VII large subunit [Clostridia bacterium]